MAWSEKKVRQLFARDPIRLKKALGKPDIKAQSRVVAAIIRAAIPPGADLDDPDMWARLAYRLGVNRILPLAEGEELPGVYDWHSRDIFYNPDTDDDAICRRIIHERAHDIQAWQRIGARRYGLERYDGDRQTVQHLVACEVEVLLKGERKPAIGADSAL